MRRLLLVLIFLNVLCDAAHAGSIGQGPFATFPENIATNAVGVWNNGTANNTVQSLNPAGGSSGVTNGAISNGSQAILVQLTQTTTITAGAVAFQVTYDGTTYQNAQPWQLMSFTSAGCGAVVGAPSYTLAPNTTAQFVFYPAGAQSAQLKLTNTISGTGSVTIYSSLAPYNPCPTSAGGGGGGGTSSNFLTTFPGVGTAIGVNQAGNMVGITADSGGNINVDCAFNCSLADEGTLAFGTTGISLIGGVFQTTPTNNPLSNSQYGSVQLTAQRAMFTNLRNASGTEVGTAAAPIQVSLANTGANATSINAAVTSLPAIPAGSNTIGSVTQASGPWSVNPTQIAGLAIATAASGVQKVGIVGGAGATLDAPIAGGSATNALAVGGVYNTSPPTPTTGQMVALQADSAGNLKVSSANIEFSQGSTTASQLGPLIQGAVTAASPSYTTATTNPVSLDTAGNLRTNCVVGCSAVSNIAQFGGSNVVTGTGPSGSGIPRVTVSNDSNVLATLTATQPTIYVAETNPADPNLAKTISFNQVNVAATQRGNQPWSVQFAPTVGPVCPNRLAFNVTASTDLYTSLSRVYICSFVPIIAGQEQVSLVEGTGSTCGTNTLAVIGATTADATHGMPFAANGGFAGWSSTPVINTQVIGNHLCVLKSGSNLLSGVLTYADHV